ncbi:MAG: hypothetical protein Kow002_04370 [Anaerolineales bacterium]
MNLRCMYCNTMFGISRENMLIALQAMDTDELTHTSFYCPKCRRANRVERKKLEMANPGWKKTIKEIAKEAAKVDENPASKPEKKPAPAQKGKKPAAKKKAAPKTKAK